MKKIVSMLSGILLLAFLAVPAFATEETQNTQSQTDTDCSHTWSQPSSVDNANHSITCTHCGAQETVSHTWSTETATTPATCTADGVKTLTCACGNSKTETITKLTHTFGAWEKVDTSKHRHVCSACSHEETAVHSWKEEVIKEATCKEDGSKKKTCTDCNAGEVIVIPKLTSHVYDNSCDKDCNSCGQTRSTSHSYGSSWSRDHSGHWNECTKCGEKKDFRSHYPGPAATEEAPQLCLTCDYVIAPQKQHVHNYSKKWTQDESAHWYECESCSVKKDHGKHTYDSDCDTHCNTCNYLNPDVHDYGNTWETDEKQHWCVCRTCGQQSEKEKHIPGPEATETQAQLCIVCDYEIEPVQEHVHSFGPAWMYDGKTHWQDCSCGEQTVPAAHTWDEGKKTDKHTRTYTCTQCLAENTEEVSGFPWWILILLVLLAGGGGAAYYYVFMIVPQKQTGKFASK